MPRQVFPSSALGLKSLYRQPAMTEDIQWMTDIFLGSLREAITVSRGQWDEPSERQQFREQLRLADTHILLSKGHRVGFYSAWDETDHWFVGAVCIRPEYHDRGFGTAAMDFIAHCAKGLPVLVAVLKSNPRARAFYERMGYRCVSATERHDLLSFQAHVPRRDAGDYEFSINDFFGPTPIGKMKQMHHPTHAKVTRWAIYGCIGLVIASVAGLVFVADRDDESLAGYVCIGFGLLGVAGTLFFAAARAVVCRCPKCKAFLVKQLIVDTDLETRKFVCKSCGVIWDSDVRARTG